MLGKFSCKMLDEIQNGQQLPEKNVLIGLQDMYRTLALAVGETPSSNLFLHQANLCTARKYWKTMLGFVSIDFTWTCICFCVSYTSCICLCFLYMAHEDKTSILDDHVNYVLICISSFPFIVFPPCFCGSHLFHRSQHCPMGIVAINPAKQKYRLWEKCSTSSCQVCLLIRIPRKCPPTQLGRWWGDERVLGI